MSREHELPQGWINAKLEEICIVIMGQSPPSSAYNEAGIGLPFFQGKTDFTNLYPNIRIWCTESTKLAEKNDVLLSVRAPVGPTNLAPSRCGVGRGLAAIRPRCDIDEKYILYAIRTLNQYLIDQSTGTTFSAVSGDVVRAFELPLAPLSEQQRIVEALEQQLSRLDAGVVALRSTQQKLKRYRAAVLKAAVEGKLTEEWRKSHPEMEPAPELLKRILVERRAKWEEEQRAKGRDPQKVKNDEPVGPDAKGLPELPKEWCWTTVAQIVARSEYGTSTKCDYEGKGIPVLRIPNIAAGEISLEDIKYSIHLLEIKETDDLQMGDVLVCRTNGSVNLIGKAALIRKPFEKPYTFASYLLRFRLFYALSLSRWFHLYITSPQGRAFIEKNAASSAGQHNISLTLMHGMIFPFPSLAEQEQIVSLVEERLSIVSTLESTIKQALKRAERMRQSILHRAFTGQLVPQDPNDEPASVLLERVRKERVQITPAQKRERSALKPRVSSPSRRVAEDAPQYLEKNIQAAEVVDAETTTQGTLWGDMEFSGSGKSSL